MCGYLPLIIRFPYSTHSLLLMKEPTVKPSCLNLVSDWNGVSAFCILLYIQFEVAQNGKKRFQSLVLDNFTSHFHWYKKDFAWAENDLEEGWQQDSIRVAQKVQLHNPPHQIQVQYPLHYPHCRPVGPTELRPCRRSSGALMDTL